MPFPKDFTQDYMLLSIPLDAAGVAAHRMVVPKGLRPAPLGYVLVGVSEIHSVVGGASAAVTIRRCRDQAPASGTLCLSATLDITATVNVDRDGSLVAAQDDRTFLEGDALALVYSGTMTGAVGVLTCAFQRV